MSGPFTAARTYCDARLLGCPWCREPVMVLVSVNGGLTSHHRCLPCGREFRVSAAIVKADLAALRDARPPLALLDRQQAQALADQAASVTQARALAAATAATT